MGWESRCLLCSANCFSRKFFNEIKIVSLCNESKFLDNSTIFKRRYASVNLAATSYEPSKPQKGAAVAPVIISHGILGSKTNWSSISKVLAEKTNRKVFTLDARNHGESPHSSEFTYHHMAEDTAEFMKKEKLKKAILIGHSMGGRTSMLFSLIHPEMVDSLIIVDISPKGVSPGFNSLPKFVKAMMEINLQAPSLAQARKHATEQLSKVIQNPGIVQFLLTNLIEDTPNNFKWRINLKTIYENFAHIGDFDCNIGKIYDGPTLFVGGGNSDYISKGDHELIKKIFPAAEIKYIPGAGHWVHAEKPREFLDIACEFINKNS